MVFFCHVLLARVPPRCVSLCRSPEMIFHGHPWLLKVVRPGSPLNEEPRPTLLYMKILQRRPTGGRVHKGGPHPGGRRRGGGGRCCQEGKVPRLLDDHHQVVLSLFIFLLKTFLSPVSPPHWATQRLSQLPVLPAHRIVLNSANVDL